jgi:hypothetical protein
MIDLPVGEEDVTMHEWNSTLDVTVKFDHQSLFVELPEISEDAMYASMQYSHQNLNNILA